MDATKAIFKDVLGDRFSFREGQYEAIEAVVKNGGRHLVVQRTGWGKSTVYFAATRLHRESGKGPTLIISPLLALTRDQQRNARDQFGLAVEALNSTNKEDHETILARWKEGEIDILYITPERLGKKDEFEAILETRIGLFVVDEAHCISDWGHDFRPDFRRIVSLLEHLGSEVPVLCTTATANERVMQDIKDQVGTLTESRGPLARKSLHLDVLRLPSHAERMAWLARFIPELPGSGIIYALTKRDAELVGDWLLENGIRAATYHSKLEEESKVQIEKALLENRLKAVVATTALGMGFDKPDLGFVVHFQRPAGVVEMYQQIGRAGRAIDEARCVMLCGVEDPDIHASLRESSFPRETDLEKIIQVLNDAEGLTASKISPMIDVPLKRVQHAIRHLEIDGAVEEVFDGSRWVAHRTANPWTPDPGRARRIISRREEEWDQLQQVVEGDLCLLKGLAQALDDPNADADCGQCSACRKLEYPEDLAPEDVAEAQLFYHQKSIVIEPRKQWMERSGKRPRIPVEERFLPGRALCKYKDAGWGTLVANGKYETHVYPDDLVEAASELINERWTDCPPVTHLVPVPNRAGTSAVLDYTLKLGERLGLPVLELIERNETGKAQKEFETGPHQLDHARQAYSLRGDPPEGATIMLIDDLVDSKWTFTVIASVLQKNGAADVVPFALADTRNTS